MPYQLHCKPPTTELDEELLEELGAALEIELEALLGALDELLGMLDELGALEELGVLDELEPAPAASP